jgi:hypothetical protein
MESSSRVPNFQIPAQYADFVSSSSVLLDQFAEGTQESDTVQIHIYMDDLLPHINEPRIQFDILQLLLKTINAMIDREVGSYLWHRQSFHLEIAYPIHTENCKSTNKTKQASLMYLKGVTRF